MANQFDIDSGSDTHLLNETFHVFSKSPSQPGVSLGGARLKSGHTVTSSDVWSQEIPAFFNAATQEKFDLFEGIATEDDLCLFNGEVWQHNGTEFVSLGTTATVLTDGAKFSKNGKEVIKYHEGHKAINLTADNNNGDGGNNFTAKIYTDKTKDETKNGIFVSQFISPTDKFVNGIPSLGYDAVVSDSTGQLSEGLTAAENYICNAYAGVIQFNKARLQDTVTVSAWEYIGEKLTETLSSIADATLSIEDKTITDPIAATDTEKYEELEDKLVTAEQVKTYVENNAKVSVSADNSAAAPAEAVTSIKVVGNTTGADVTITTAKDTDATDGSATISVGATLKKASVTNGAIDTTEGNGDKVVSADSAKAIADKSASDAVNAIAASDTWGTESQTTQFIKVALDLDATTDKLVVTANDIASATTLGDHTTNGDIHVTAVQKTSWTTGAEKAGTAIQTGASDNTNYITVTKSGTELTVSPVLCKTALASLTENSSGIVTPTLIRELNNKVDSYHKVPQFSVVVAKSIDVDNVTYVPTIDGASETPCAKNTIYLVAQTDAAAGSAIEYLCYNTGTEEAPVLVIEQIGTTEVDLTEYAKTADISGEVSNAGITVTLADGKLTGSVDTADVTKNTDTGEVTIANGDYVVTATDAQTIAIAEARPIVKGYNSDGTTSSVESKTINISDGRETANDLWGTKATVSEKSVELEDGSVTTQSVITITSASVKNPNASDSYPAAWNEDITKVEDNKAYTGTDGITFYANIQTEAIIDGSYMFYQSKLASFSSDLPSLTYGASMFGSCSTLQSFSGDLSSLTNGTHMFYETRITSFSSDLPSLTYGASMFNSSALKSFGSNLPSLTNGSQMFSKNTALESFSSNLPSLTNGISMFEGSGLKSWDIDLPNLTNGNSMFNENTELAEFNGDLHNLTIGNQMFRATKLENFHCDLSKLTNGDGMFYGTNLASFQGDLSSLKTAVGMFSCTSDDGNTPALTTESVMYIADTIKNWSVVQGDTTTHQIDINIIITEEKPKPSDEEDGYFTEIHKKGWEVHVNGSESAYEPTNAEDGTSTGALADGEETTTPIAYWAKPIEVDQKVAHYVSADGKYYNIVGGQFIYVSDPETYGQFTSYDHAVQEITLGLGLTEYEYIEPTEEETPTEE